MNALNDKTLEKMGHARTSLEQIEKNLAMQTNNWGKFNDALKDLSGPQGEQLKRLAGELYENTTFINKEIGYVHEAVNDPAFTVNA